MIFWQYMPSRSEALFCHLAHEWRICCRDGKCEFFKHFEREIMRSVGALRVARCVAGR